MEEGLAPETQFLSFNTNSEAVRMLRQSRWWNWSNEQKIELQARVMASDTVSLAMAKDGVWVRTVPVSSSSKSPFVFFVELKLCDCTPRCQH